MRLLRTNSLSKRIMAELFLLIFIFFFLCNSLIRPCFRPNNFPPGPPQVPIFGFLPHFVNSYGGDMLAYISAMEKRYGKVFSFNIGSERAVVVADFELYKEVANKEEFQFRTDLGAFGDSRCPDGHGQIPGLMFSNGQEWIEQRRFATKTLKDFGFGTKSMEQVIQYEVIKATNHIRDGLLDKKVSLNKHLNLFVVNALWKIVAGERFKYDDPCLNNLVAKIERKLNKLNQAGALTLFSWLKYIIPEWCGYVTDNEVVQDMLEVIDKAKANHEDYVYCVTEEEGDLEPRDFIDEYLRKKRIIDSIGSSVSSFFGTRGSNNMRLTLMDLFLAGSDTTAATMDWAIMWICKHPEVATRLQEEIDSVVGRNRMPSLADRPNLPYVEAVINEVNRITGLSYMSITRSTYKDTNLGHYMLPKGTRVFFDLYNMMNDPDYWKNPLQFSPDRFIDVDSGKFKPDVRCIPFGIGRRNCMGKSLAKNELFLFLATFFQEFNFSFPEDEGQGGPEIGPSLGVLRTCPDYQVIITARS